MRAIAVSAFRAEPGLVELPKPGPGAGEVRVKVEYAALNPLDWQTADGPREACLRRCSRSSWAPTSRAGWT